MTVSAPRRDHVVFLPAAMPQGTGPGLALGDPSGSEGSRVPRSADPGVEPAAFPETAGLLAAVFPFDATALERALRALREPEADTDSRDVALLHWLGLSTLLLGSALAYTVARRPRALPASALVPAAPLGTPRFLPEDPL